MLVSVDFFWFLFDLVAFGFIWVFSIWIMVYCFVNCIVMFCIELYIWFCFVWIGYVSE